MNNWILLLAKINEICRGRRRTSFYKSNLQIGEMQPLVQNENGLWGGGWKVGDYKGANFRAGEENQKNEKQGLDRMTIKPKSPISLYWLVPGNSLVGSRWSFTGTLGKFPAVVCLRTHKRNWFGLIVERKGLWHFYTVHECFSVSYDCLFLF